jgi:hypothetical protein
MGILVRHYLVIEPGQDLDELVEQYAEALWIEERQMTLMANAVAKGMGGK